MQQAFFSLVRAGLWGTPADAALFRGLTPAQWQELHRLAHTQSLLAVVFDGLNTLPADLRPPRPLYLQWAAQTLQIEQANDRLDRMIVRLDRLYTDAGLHPVLLKGQGMAACYRQPRHRQCGDIDVYLGKDGQPRANRLLLEAGAQETGEESDKHASYELDGVHVENHRLVNRTNNPLANRRFCRLVCEWYPQDAERRIGMATPPPTFNALYIFLHAFEHFLNSGIGLRQLCDWCCLCCAPAGLTSTPTASVATCAGWDCSAPPAPSATSASAAWACRPTACPSTPRAADAWAKTWWTKSSPRATSASMTAASRRAPRATGGASGTPSAEPRAVWPAFTVTLPWKLASIP